MADDGIILGHHLCPTGIGGQLWVGGRAVANFFRSRGDQSQRPVKAVIR